MKRMGNHGSLTQQIPISLGSGQNLMSDSSYQSGIAHQPWLRPEPQVRLLLLVRSAHPPWLWPTPLVWLLLQVRSAHQPWLRTEPHVRLLLSVRWAYQPWLRTEPHVRLLLPVRYSSSARLAASWPAQSWKFQVCLISVPCLLLWNWAFCLQKVGSPASVFFKKWIPCLLEHCVSCYIEVGSLSQISKILVSWQWVDCVLPVVWTTDSCFLNYCYLSLQWLFVSL